RVDAVRRRQHLGVTTVHLPNPRPDGGRVREVSIRGSSRPPVPPYEVWTKDSERELRRRAALAQIPVPLVEPARGGVAVDNLAPIHTCTVRPAARAAEDDGSVDAEPVERRREQREGEPVMSAQDVNAVERRCMDLALAE